MWNVSWLLVLFWSDLVRPCDHPDLTHTLHTLALNYSSIASLTSIGTSVQGRELWVMTVSDSVALRPILRPQVKLIGNINGFSGPTCAILLELIKTLLEGYWKERSEERTILQSVELQVLFDMNPDGYAKSNKGSCTDRKGRENGNNIDLNRNFPYVFPEDEDTKIRQPETEAVIRWTLSNNFVLSISLVAGHTAVIIPFDDKLIVHDDQHVTPDNDMFIHLASKYLTSVGWQPSWNCPSLKRDFELGWVNGAVWYPARGTMMDFNYVRGHTPELTIGLTCCRNEADEQALKHLWLRHKQGLYELFVEATHGIRGQVVDSVTEDVLENVMLTRIDPDSMLPPVPWFTSPQGEFWRLLPQGSHVIEASKEGYKTGRVNIEVMEGHGSVFSIQLDPSSLVHTFPEDEEESPAAEPHPPPPPEEEEGGEEEGSSTEESQTPTPPPQGPLPTTMGKKFHRVLGAMWEALRGPRTPSAPSSTSSSQKTTPPVPLLVIIPFIHFVWN